MAGRITTSSWRRLAREITRSPRALLALAACATIDALPALLSGYLIAAALDHGFLAGEPTAGLLWLGAFGAVLAVGALGAGAAYPWLGRIVEPLRDTLARRVVDGTLRRAAAGENQPDATTIARLTRQVETVRDVVAGQLLVLRQFAITSVAVVIGVTALDARLALYVAVPLVLALALFALLLRPLFTRQRDQYLADEKIADTTSRSLTGLRDVVAHGAQHEATGALDESISSYTRASHGLANLASLRRLTVAIGAQLPVLLVLAAGPSLLRSGLSTGEMVGAITYLTTSLEPMLRTFVQSVGASGPRLAVALGRLAAADPQSPEHTGPSRTATPGGTRLDVRAVSFRYGTRAQPIVAGLTLTIPPQHHLAVVGPSGIGKSTLANMIAGITEPDTGEIRLGGVGLQSIAPSHLHQRRVLIPQQAYVFTGSLAENLTYLRQDATIAELDHTLQRLGMTGLLDQLGGYSGLVDPRALSAGQRQLIALARAYLAPAPITILDEATCHLDPRAEAMVERAFRERGGTLIVIAHRISSATRADRILVLDGDCPRVGTHQDLLARSPLYASMAGHWNSEVPTPMAETG